MCHEEYGHLISRTRLHLGLTQEEFGERFAVEASTVSRWEHGKMHPAPAVWKEIIKLSPIDHIDAIKLSSLLKYICPMDNLIDPVIISKGYGEVYRGQHCRLIKNAATSPFYSCSGIRSLESISRDSRWLSGQILSLNAHCVAVNLPTKWIDMTVTAMPVRKQALVEYAPSADFRNKTFHLEMHPLEIKETIVLTQADL